MVVIGSPINKYSSYIQAITCQEAFKAQGLLEMVKNARLMQVNKSLDGNWLKVDSCIIMYLYTML